MLCYLAFFYTYLGVFFAGLAFMSYLSGGGVFFWGAGFGGQAIEVLGYYYISYTSEHLTLADLDDQTEKHKNKTTKSEYPARDSILLGE